MGLFFFFQIKPSIILIVYKHPQPSYTPGIVLCICIFNKSSQNSRCILADWRHKSWNMGIMAPVGHRRCAHRLGGRARELAPHSHRYPFQRPPSSDTARGGHPGWQALPGTLGGAPKNPGEAGRIGHVGTAASTLEGSASLAHRPGPESAPGLPAGSALCQGAGPTHLNEIEAGQEGDTVLDDFALWPLLRRHPGRLPGSASSAGRGVHGAAEASCLLQPQAPGAAAVTVPAGTSGAGARRAAPPPPPPLFAATGRPGARGSLFPLCPGPAARFSLRRDVQLPPPNCCCNGFPFLPPFPRPPPPLPGCRAVGTWRQDSEKGAAPLDSAAASPRSWGSHAPFREAAWVALGTAAPGQLENRSLAPAHRPAGWQPASPCAPSARPCWGLPESWLLSRKDRASRGSPAGRTPWLPPTHPCSQAGRCVGVLTEPRGRAWSERRDCSPRRHQPKRSPSPFGQCAGLISTWWLFWQPRSLSDREEENTHNIKQFIIILIKLL